MIFKHFIFVLIFLPLLFSCSMNSSQKSFISSLDTIDSFITQKQYNEAISELEKLEKTAYSSWYQLGIFRRYKQMGQNDRAEKILFKAIKKNPDNLELCAVYTNFLINLNKIDQAITFGKKLQGTKYGSIYSQAVMTQTLKKSTENHFTQFFNATDFYPVYYDAYIGSKNSAWLRNCALLFLARGEYENACKNRPIEIYESIDAYFWALAMYDAKRYGDAISYCDAARSVLKNELKTVSKKAGIEQIFIIEADSYTALKDEENAEKIRQEFLSSFKKKNDDYIIKDEFKNQNETLASIFTNCARWAIDNNEHNNAAKYLIFTVENWPDFIPGLYLYADFAYNSSISQNESEIELELRKKGITTLEMQKHNELIKIPVSDAQYRINQSLKRNPSPLLYVINLDLRYKTSTNFSQKEKIADMWNILENNEISPSIYPEELLDYAVNFLLKNKLTQEAWELFSKNLCKKYDLELKDDFWNELYAKQFELSQIELEYVSYFAAVFSRANDAIRLYEKCVFESPVTEKTLPAISPVASDSACINLATIYSSFSRNLDALDLYGKIFGRTPNLNTKSQIMYRIAYIYFYNGDKKSARKNAEYALTLNNRNVQARLLLNQL